MLKPSSLGWIAALVCVCAISYGLGNGWIRLGSPSRSDGVQVQTSDNAPTPGELDPSALDGLEPLPEPRRSAPIDDRVRRVEDGNTAPAAETPGNEPALDANAINKAIDDAANAMVTALSEKIKAGADRSNIEDALSQITADAKSAAFAKFKTAVGAETKSETVHGLLAADAAKSAAKQAAEDAIDATSKKLAGARKTLTADDVEIKYSITGGDQNKDLPTDGAIKSDGPEITFKAIVKMSNEDKGEGPVFDDTDATVTLELKPHSDSFKPYLKVSPFVSPPSDGKPAELTVKTRESGSYDLVVTVTPTDRPALPPYKRSVVLSPETIARPTIASLKAMQDDRLVTFDLGGASMIEVGSGRLTIGATITNAKEGRNLAVIDAGADMVLTSRGGAPVVQTIDAQKQAELLVTIPDVDLTDSPKRIAVVDLWSREASNALTVVIPGDGARNRPSRTVGISGRTGKNAVFGEYTPPRELADGFKPSDKVETRVARLYYFRDAHRVAQIVNRDVKSYNRVAVDTRRRMADDARQEADALTDARRIDEIVSIRGAQAARAAEQKVRQAQNDLDAAVRAENEARALDPRLDTALAASESRDTALQTQIDALKGQLGDAKKEDEDKQDKQKILGLTAAISQATARRHEEAGVQSRLKQQKSDARAIIDGKKAEAARLALDNARIAVETARTTEAEQSDKRVRSEQLEDRSRENQFRQEVAAAHEDPDTYVPGKPTSIDPVLQVSVSVIGEGLIQLRGPIKGINVIRTMINQIDAPTSQVRVGIHTVQINGEHGDRMEKVATRIQDYVDHARFLTSQSAQMLRNAVVKVAAEKAHEAVMACPNFAAHAPGVPCPDDTQEARDARYQEAFFGCDFLNELRAIDSEFLMTGNKLLSLHSMDTTSLASALFLLALAKNDVRMQILAEFQQSMQVDLPAAENTYYAAGAVGRVKGHHDEFKMFACNAKFQSFMGFFDAQVAGSETLNPLQREFLKLAQIFKSRLVTELEYDQRVKERGLLEDRIDPKVDRDAIRREEETLRATLKNRYLKILSQRDLIFETLAKSQEKVRESEAKISDSLRLATNLYSNIDWDKLVERSSGGDPAAIGSVLEDIDPSKNGHISMFVNNKEYRFSKGFRLMENQTGEDSETDEIAKARIVSPEVSRTAEAQIKAIDALLNFTFSDQDFKALQAARESIQVVTGPNQVTLEDIRARLANGYVLINRIGEDVQRGIRSVNQSDDDLLTVLGSNDPDPRKLYAAWLRIKRNTQNLLRENSQFRVSADKQIAELDARFKELLTVNLNYESAKRTVEISRRPLDHKRLLDMLIDDVEDKYIDLLEGTRSHTANIDAYIKRIATALDDDFNTQFYYPAFTEIRRASRFHDVQLGKIETTNVLANNRGFGKVEPQATMEFDLPKRDILINEAMNGALAMTKDFGALVNDPTFLSMAKLRSGQPTSSLTPGAGEGVNTVRNALPGLSRADDEQLFSQQGAGRTQFGSAMEALIPDPAVYKFETGTGFEIRPVVQPDGQSVVFHFNYMYTTNVREPVRADEKHLGRVKRHFIDTDVQLGNYELREVSRYQVALKASRTSRGVPLFEDIPGVGVLFRPLPSAESALQENIVLGQSTIFPTLFDLMGLRWAPAVADLDTLRLRNDNYIVRGRYRDVQNRVFDISSGEVDEFLQIPPAERRSDLYRSQETIPDVHPNGYRGSGLNYQNSRMHEGYDPTVTNPQRGAIPSESRRANPRTPAPPPPGLIDEGAEPFPVDPQGGMIDGPVIENPGPRAEPGGRVAVRPRIAPPRQYTTPPTTQRPPAAIPAPTRPAPAIAPPGRPEPPLNGPAATNWQRSAPVTSSASRAKDPAVGRAAFSQPKPQTQPKPQPQPKRQSLFTRMLGGGE